MSRAKTSWERAMIALASGEYYVFLDRWVKVPGSPIIAYPSFAKNEAVWFVSAPGLGVVAGDTLHDLLEKVKGLGGPE